MFHDIPQKIDQNFDGMIQRNFNIYVGFQNGAEDWNGRLKYPLSEEFMHVL